MSIGRRTTQRKVILDVFQEKKTSHITAEEIFEIVRKKHPTIGRATVYRNLTVLSERGYIRRIPVPSGADCFDANVHNHYHVKCRLCAGVSDIDAPFFFNLHNQLPPGHGFVIESHDLIFHGICPACIKKKNVAPARVERPLRKLTSPARHHGYAQNKPAPSRASK